MHETLQLGWAGWAIVCAIVGVGVGWERVAHPELVDRYPLGLKLILAAWLAAMVALDVESLRGFLVVFLSAVGAYKLAATIAEYLGHRLGLGRFWPR